MENKNWLITSVAVVAGIFFFQLFFGERFIIGSPLTTIKENYLSTKTNLDNMKGEQQGDRLQKTLKDIVEEKRGWENSDYNEISSSVRYKIIENGFGLKAKEGSNIRAGYQGVMIRNGEEIVFDVNLENGIEFKIGDNRLIKGFEYGVIGAREGEIRVLEIQPEAGYGSVQVGQIPANEVLYFIIIMHEVK